MILSKNALIDDRDFESFWSVRHVYFAFCCHDMILSKNVLIDDRDFESF